MLQLRLELHCARLEERQFSRVVVHAWSVAKRVLSAVEELQTRATRGRWAAQVKAGDQDQPVRALARRPSQLHRLAQRRRASKWLRGGGRTYLDNFRILRDALPHQVLREDDPRRDTRFFRLSSTRQRISCG